MSERCRRRDATESFQELGVPEDYYKTTKYKSNSFVFVKRTVNESRQLFLAIFCTKIPSVEIV